MFPPLFRRRAVWLPTWWVGLLMLGVAVLAAVWFWINAYELLAPQRPARGASGDGARTLVVEGWLDEGELRQAVATVRAGHYERVLTSGGPIEPWSWSERAPWHDYATRSAAWLRANGVSVPVVAVPTPLTTQDRTYLSAVAVRAWARRSGVRPGAIDLYSVGVHARRSWLLYRMAFGDEVEVGVFAAQPSDYDAQRWWGSSAGVKATMGEVLSLAWTKCCFWPAPNDARWAVTAPQTPAP